MPVVVVFDLPNDHFDIEDEYYKMINVPLKIGDSNPIIFNLRAKKEGLADIKLEFFQEGTYLGELKMRTQVMPTGLELSMDKQNTAIPEWSIIKKYPPQPDISLIITQVESKPKARYDILLHSQEEPFIPMGSIELEGDPESKFRAIFKDIENTNLAPHIVDDRLKAKGLTLYDELFPIKLKERYWKIRDKIKSVQVFSREPWIPWEIVRPWQKEGSARPVEDLFLCERFNFSRWLIGTSQQLKEQVSAVKLVIPSDTKLDNVSRERDWIQHLGEINRVGVSVDSSYEEFTSTLRKGNCDVVHFCAHGRHLDGTPLLSTIELENGVPIRPENISGEATTMLGESNPIVIMNTCQSAAQGFSLTGMQSWVTRFLDYGASAFVGTVWSVSDQTAFEFTKGLYKHLFEGKTIGEAVMAARIKCKTSGDPSWLAYQLYAQPNTQVKFGSK